MTFGITVDRKWGGFYLYRGWIGMRLCVGFVAFDVLFESLEDALRIAMRKGGK